MADHAALFSEYEAVKHAYDDMEVTYKRQMQQVLTNPEISKVKKELWKTRAACADLGAERDQLLDRISELETASRHRPDPSITSRLGTDRDGRLKARLLPALREPLSLDYDPLASSRHCGPEAVHSRNQKRMQLESHDAGFPRVEAEREMIKLPKRSRTSKQQQQPPPQQQQLLQSSTTTTGSAATGAAAAVGFPVESTSTTGPYHQTVDAEGSHVLGIGSTSNGGEPLVARSGTRIRIKPMVGADREQSTSVDIAAGPGSMTDQRRMLDG